MFPPHKCLLNGPVTSIRWRLALVLKEPICCYYVNVGTSVVCHVHCLGQAHLHCKIFAFEGQNEENKNFSVKCFLPAFHIVAPGPAISLELFASTAYASYHAYHIYPRPVFLRRHHSFTSRKLHVSVQTFLCSFHQFD